MLYQQYTWGLMGVGGELTYRAGTSPHTWGTNLCTIPPNISYKYPTVVHSVWQGDMSICVIHKELSKDMKEGIYTI